MTDNTQGTQGVFEPITPERMTAIMEHLYKDVRARLKENCYIHPVVFEKLFKGLTNSETPNILIHEGVTIYQDTDVPIGLGYLCTARQFEIYKALVAHPWIDKSDPAIDLYKVAAGLYDSEIKNPPVNPFTWSFTEGEKFPTGATFRPDSIDYLKSDIITKF